MATPTVLAGSEPAAVPDNLRVADLPNDAALRVTVRVRRRRRLDRSMTDATDGPETLDRATLTDLFGAGRTDLEAVARFAALHGIAADDADRAARSVTLHGTAAQFTAAFGSRLGVYDSAGGKSRSHDGGILLPPELAPIVRAVIGFDDRRAAASCILRGRPAPLPGSAFLPAHLAAAYRFPTRFDGTGQRIGVIGFATEVPRTDIDAGCRLSGIAAPALRVKPAAADDWTTDDRSAGDRDALGAMLQLLAALAPRAELVVQLATPTERGCIAALAAAVHGTDPPLDVLCLGWAGAEEGWSVQAALAIDDILRDAAMLGITVCAATGDDGAGLAPGSDTASVSLPASSPHALACGGATLILATGGMPPWGTPWQTPWEAVWNDAALGGGAGGGGVSERFAVPAWQQAHGPPLSVRTAASGRGVPDVAAAAAPFPGLLCVLDGAAVACGGTALSAALWAALIARINQGTGRARGFITPRLYALPQASVFNSVLFGGIETTGRVGGYFARPGWDVCTGLGTPRGEELLRELAYRWDEGPGPRAEGPRPEGPRPEGPRPEGSVALSWFPLPGYAHEVVEGPDGTLWALGISVIGGLRPLFRSSARGWLAVPGAWGSALAVARDGMPWLADAGGAIRAWDGSRWHEHPGRAGSLAFAADGTLWIVGRRPTEPDGAVQRWTGARFEPVGATARHVRAGPSGQPLLLTGSGEALRLYGADWSLTAQNVADIACDLDGRIWAVSRTGGRIWCRDERNATWLDVPMATAERLIPLRHGGLIALQQGGRLFISREAASGRRAA